MSPLTVTSIFLRGNAQGGRDELAGELGTGGQRAEEEVTRTSRGAGAPHAFVGFRLVDGATNVHGTR